MQTNQNQKIMMPRANQNQACVNISPQNAKPKISMIPKSWKILYIHSLFIWASVPPQGPTFPIQSVAHFFMPNKVFTVYTGLHWFAQLFSASTLLHPFSPLWMRARTGTGPGPERPVGRKINILKGRDDIDRARAGTARHGIDYKMFTGVHTILLKN